MEIAELKRVVNVKNEPSAVSLASAKPAFAWEETKFSMWVLYSSSLRVKLMPLQVRHSRPLSWSYPTSLGLA